MIKKRLSHGNLPANETIRPLYQPGRGLRWLALLLLAWSLGAAAAQPPPAVQAGLPPLREAGHGLYEYLWFDIYTATLWAPDGKFSYQAPFALDLHYARHFAARDIAERSIEEMRRQGPLDEATARRWQQAMTDAFQDVRKGDHLTGVYHPDGRVAFFYNGSPTNSVDIPGFGRRFFDIWLGPETSAPGLRASLLGKTESDDE